MNNERYQKGSKITKEYMGIYAEKADTMVRKLDEQLADDLICQFGDVYGRKGLSPQNRMIVTLTTLTSVSSLDNLRLHVNSAVNVGLTPEEITEVIIQCMPYIGIPKTLDALKVVKAELEKYRIAEK